MRQHRRSLKSRERNRHTLSRLRSQLKAIRQLVADGKADEARAQLGNTLSMIDHSATKGVVHKNAAARTKSRLTRQVNGLS